jgi:hypothetical protein
MNPSILRIAQHLATKECGSTNVIIKFCNMQSNEWWDAFEYIRRRDINSTRNMIYAK